jgi:hypothetical protein
MVKIGTNNVNLNVDIDLVGIDYEGLSSQGYAFEIYDKETGTNLAHLDAYDYEDDPNSGGPWYITNFHNASPYPVLSCREDPVDMEKLKEWIWWEVHFHRSPTNPKEYKKHILYIMSDERQGPYSNYLFLPDEGIDDEYLILLSKSSFGNNINKLKLSSNKFTHKGLGALINSPNFTNIEILILEENDIGDEGAKVLAESPNLMKLKNLNLWNNKIGDEGAKALAKSPNLISLEEMNLGVNNIGDEGAKALATSHHLTSLTKLNMIHNLVGYEGLVELNNSRIEKIDLQFNKFNLGGEFWTTFDRRKGMIIHSCDAWF